MPLLVLGVSLYCHVRKDRAIWYNLETVIVGVKSNTYVIIVICIGLSKSVCEERYFSWSAAY
jgi:hypothetical protein